MTDAQSRERFEAAAANHFGVPLRDIRENVAPDGSYHNLEVRGLRDFHHGYKAALASAPVTRDEQITHESLACEMEECLLIFQRAFQDDGSNTFDDVADIAPLRQRARTVLRQWADRQQITPHPIRDEQITRKEFEVSDDIISKLAEWWSGERGSVAARGDIKALLKKYHKLAANNPSTEIPMSDHSPEITRILDRLKGGVGTFLQGEGQVLASYVEGLERQLAEYSDIDEEHQVMARTQGALDDENAFLRRQLAERDAEIERLKARITAGIQTFNEIARG